MPATLYSALRVAHDDVLALADIDAGVGGAAHRDAVDQHVLRRDRIDAVGAVLLVRPAGPFDAQIAEGDLVGALRLDAVALGVLDREVLEHDAVGGDQQALAGAGLALEGEDGLVGPGALHRDVVDIERQAFGELDAAGADADRVAGLGEDQRLDQPFRRAFAGLDRDLGGGGRAARLKCRQPNTEQAARNSN